MLRCHQDDTLNYFRVPIHNGTVEGLDNKAKLVIHKAYGSRSAAELRPQSLQRSR
jgi:transposase